VGTNAHRTTFARRRARRGESKLESLKGTADPSDDFATMVTTMVPPRRRARRLAVLLAATAAALPRTCEVSIGEDYLLGEPAALKCGLPVSRSYLLSKYGLALVAEAPASPAAGRPLTITVKGCDVKEAVDAYPWFDSYTTNGTRDLGWCDPSALEVWVRAYGPSIEVADVVPSAETCAWTATFRRGLLPGAYAVDVLNTWLRGDEEPKTPHYDAVQVRRGRGWRGEQFDWQNAAGGDLKRGSPFMLCGDRCMLYDGAVGRGGASRPRLIKNSK
jgi:hypothetical protein